MVIVGGGHNGLTAAAYLARTGRSVAVLERLDHVGGAAISAEAFEGVDARLSRYSYLVSLLPQRIIDDLGLEIRLVRRRYSSYTPVPGFWPALAARPADLSTPATRWGVGTDHPRILVCGSGAQRSAAVSGIGVHNAAMAILEADA